MKKRSLPGLTFNMLYKRVLPILALLVVFLIALSPHTSNVSSSIPSSHVSLNGTLITATDGTQVVFQRAISQRPPRATVLFFHGCSHSATDFFPKGPTCTTCIGLPEELRLVRMTLSRGFSVVALSSTNRHQKCWHAVHEGQSQDSGDYERVASALKVASQHAAYTENTPLFAVGASSGGGFATSLRPRFPIRAANAIVASSVSTSHPQAFTHMAQRDKRTASRVAGVVKELHGKGMKGLDLPVRAIPIDNNFLDNAFPDWSEELKKEVIHAFSSKGFIDDKGFLKEDPRKSNWRTAIRHLEHKLNDSLVPDQSPLSEEMNRAWGAHEMTADRYEEVLDFFEAHLKN